MRLTLRTLLAYLDDVLSPADTKMIGEKIQESPMAQLLVSRIREVMRRRRLKSPDVSGPEMGVDPNVVAQYLDNTLPANRYADVERVLLASDEMLAEAAACHQILTLTLANPTEVSQSSLDRLYALGPVESSSQLKTGEATPSSTKRPVELAAGRNGLSVSAAGRPALAMSSMDDDRITTVPDYLKPAPWSQRVLPTTTIALLVVICATVLAQGLMVGIQKASNEMQRKGAGDSSPAVASSHQNSRPGASRKAEANMEVASHAGENVAAMPSNPLGTVGIKIPDGIDPAPPADATDEPLPPLKPAATQPEMPADAFVPPKPADASKPGEGAGQAMPPNAAPDAKANSPVTYSSTEGVIVRYNDQNGHWFVAPHKSPLIPGEIIANLEPFDALLDFEKSGLRATLIGEAVVKILSPAETKIRGLGIGRGRMLFQLNHQNDFQGGALGISIGEDLWKLELLTNDTICGLEVSVRKPTQFQKMNDYHWYQASLYVHSGTARWTNADGVAVEIKDHMALNIVPEKAASVRPVPIALLTAPDWCDPLKRKQFALRRYQTQFERSIDPDKPVEQSMLTLVQTAKIPKIAELAARTLAAIDNYQGLVETLAQCESEEARFAAREGLRQWLPMGADHGQRLKAELELIYPPADADAVYRMLWGFSREDVKNSKVASLQFTNWMRNPRREVRELADYWVEELIGRKTEYRAQDPKESHIRRIEDQIERDNGLIKGP